LFIGRQPGGQPRSDGQNKEQKKLGGFHVAPPQQNPPTASSPPRLIRPPAGPLR
jgi:hypothetical protein